MTKVDAGYKLVLYIKGKTVGTAAANVSVTAKYAKFDDATLISYEVTDTSISIVDYIADVITTNFPQRHIEARPARAGKAAPFKFYLKTPTTVQLDLTTEFTTGALTGLTPAS